MHLITYPCPNLKAGLANISIKEDHGWLWGPQNPSQLDHTLSGLKRPQNVIPEPLVFLGRQRRACGWAPPVVYHCWRPWCIPHDSRGSWNVSQCRRQQTHPERKQSIAKFMEIKGSHTVRCRDSAVNFPQNSHNRHSIARPWGRSMGCLLWVWRVIYILLLSSQNPT